MTVTFFAPAARHIFNEGPDDLRVGAGRELGRAVPADVRL